MRKSADIPGGRAGQTGSSLGRIASLDGLRGVAATIVVLFHYLCLKHPETVPDYATEPHWIIDTPVAILWNGPFAVFVFFVLSGFVMAAAAHRRHDQIVTNISARYLRLALPVTMSVLLALFWLTLFPTATRDLVHALDEPSRWLNFTVQEPLPSLRGAIRDGLIGNFLRGGSLINNVLWTMQIELIGSLALFAIYWIGANRAWLRFGSLLAFAYIGVFHLRDAYLCFASGALLYESYRGGLVHRVPVFLGILALVAAVILGAPGKDYAGRMGLEWLPWRLQPGNVHGLAPVIAATLLLFSFLRLSRISLIFSAPLPQWLGRISFALYLVHVPLLYTIVAWEYLHLSLPEPFVVLGYAILAVAIAHAFTLTVDEPSIRLISAMRPLMGHADVAIRNAYKDAVAHLQETCARIMNK